MSMSSKYESTKNRLRKFFSTAEMPMKHQETNEAKVKKLVTYKNDIEQQRRCRTATVTNNSNQSNSTSIWVECTRLDVNRMSLRSVKTSTPLSKAEAPVQQIPVQKLSYHQLPLQQNPIQQTPVPIQRKEKSKKQMKFLQRKLYIVCDYKSSLMYGDLNVKQGDMVSLICESDKYYFVENQSGHQGFIPCYICVDLDEVIFNAYRKQQARVQNKITSL